MAQPGCQFFLREPVGFHVASTGRSINPPSVEIILNGVPSRYIRKYLALDELIILQRSVWPACIRISLFSCPLISSVLPSLPSWRSTHFEMELPLFEFIFGCQLHVVYHQDTFAIGEEIILGFSQRVRRTCRAPFAQLRFGARDTKKCPRPEL